MVFPDCEDQDFQQYMLCKSSTSTRQPLLDQFSSKDRSNSAISSRSCTISMRRVPLSTLLMNDCGRPEPLNTVLGSGQPPSCVSSVGSAGLRVRVCRHWNLGKGKSRRRAASLQGLKVQSGEQRRHRQQANYLGEQLAAYLAKRGRHIAHLSGIHSGNPSLSA